MFLIRTKAPEETSPKIVPYLTLEDEEDMRFEEFLTTPLKSVPARGELQHTESKENTKEDLQYDESKFDTMKYRDLVHYYKSIGGDQKTFGVSKLDLIDMIINHERHR